MTKKAGNKKQTNTENNNATTSKTQAEEVLTEEASAEDIQVEEKVVRAVKSRSAEKYEERSLLTSFDKNAGLLIGFVEGVIFAFLFLALLVPVTNLSSPEFSSMIMDQLRNSWFAGALYDNNLLTLVTGGLFG